MRAPAVATGFAKGGAAIRLRYAGDDEVILHWGVRFRSAGWRQLGGRLIRLHSRQETGRRVLRKFGAVVSAS